MFFNSDTTSVFSRYPSEFVNVTDSPYQDCYGDGYLEPYDPRCRPWYTYAKDNEGYFFYEPYKDLVKNNLVMTLSSQVKIGQNFQSVNSIAFDISDLIQIFVGSQNQYSVVFHEFNNTIFHHPQLNENSVISWQELEFQNITESCLTEIDLEKQEFRLTISILVKIWSQKSQFGLSISEQNFQIQNTVAILFLNNIDSYGY
ncbi:tetratricopeptide repeat protein (macronuclear) [Tetrahymena thermophila SB210]|uniref:Tetratricopeptide repeat protein n=1 Tax=Tetrahymena thermophila (strain SB210) TaxID=312017 RepID=I7MEB7_TETTS|nr:tetratricopeptide repeat protein [Tetrahymena thermophila SB210]EAR96023.2 tetratricopeptide repeat protein [Tetrahymena thermophila SB210]|eukprot:XP_001016268.2 tetratricopeptide repeat protein [Tetrahymena thermophila SB210]